MTIENNEIGNEQPEIALDSDAQAASEDDLQKPVFNKIQVQDVIKREKAKAYERGKREALMELQQQNQAPVQEQAAAPQQTPMQAPQQAQEFGGMPQMSQEQIAQMIMEQAPQALQAHIQQAKKTEMVNSFISKMEVAEEKYPGLEAELNKLNYSDPRIHTFIDLANRTDNTAEVMKEVLDNPSKLESLLNMAHNQPYMAQKALASLSDSIKTNQQALAQESQARDPMSKLKSSATAGLADSSDVSVRDLRKMLSRKK